jgi:hypothetical protein
MSRKEGFKLGIEAAAKVAGDLAHDAEQKAKLAAHNEELYQRLFAQARSLRAVETAINALPIPDTPAGDVVELLKRMSDALLNIRPLGGSEMFMAYGDGFIADPEYCERLIVETRQQLHEDRCKIVRLERAASTAPVGDGEYTLHKQPAVFCAYSIFDSHNKRVVVLDAVPGHEYMLPKIMAALNAQPAAPVAGDWMKDAAAEIATYAEDELLEAETLSNPRIASMIARRAPDSGALVEALKEAQRDLIDARDSARVQGDEFRHGQFANAVSRIDTALASKAGGEKLPPVDYSGEPTDADIKAIRDVHAGDVSRLRERGK